MKLRPEMQAAQLIRCKVNNQIYPIWTYSYLAFLLPLGILAEAAGYKTVLVLSWLARLATRVVLIWGNGLGAMQATQVTFGKRAGLLTFVQSLFVYCVSQPMV